ncbi:MAG: C25 family cysteine peptidase, partial [Bacteroidia bacterium]
MKKAILLLVGCCLSFHTLQSQIVYAYDWHQPFDGKAMLKIKTWEDGLYNIRQSAVSHLSPALANAPADSLRLYFRGEQVRIKVFPNGARGWSKVEFLGQYLDGAEETQLYRNNKTGVPEPISQTNSRVSLFTDTCAYYLVASGHDVPLRWKDEGDFNFQNSQPLASFPFRSSLNFFPEDLNNTLNILSGGAAYDPYNSLNCDYVLGEGYVSRASFGQGDSRTFRVQTPNAVPGTQQVSMQSRVFHRSKTQARLRITYNGQSAALLDTFWPSSNIYIHTYQRSFSAVVNNESEFRFEALANGPADNNHIAWLDMNYERLPRFDHDSSMYFPAIPAGSYLRLEDVGGRDSIWFFSKKSGQRFRGVMQNDTAHVLLAALNTTSSLLAYTDESIREPILDSARPKALCDPQSGADMLIITHPQLDSSAHAYAAFRDSAGLSTRIVFIDDIYDAFGYGSATPLAIHRFINCALERWNQKPQYVLLWGDSDYRFRRNGPNNLIPTYGFPSSDIYFTSPLNPLDSDDILPQIPIGRVCIQTNKDGFTYLKHARCWRSDVNEKWMSKGSFF